MIRALRTVLEHRPELHTEEGTFRMPVNANSTVSNVFTRDTRHPSVLVADGYGLNVHVHHGQLVVRDGIGRHRRERRLSRAERAVRRLVLLGHTGSVTLDAIRWCADVGIALVQIDTEGRVLMVGTNPSRADSRLLRAQAAAPSGEVGVVIARQLLAAKIAGQADVAEHALKAPDVARSVRATAAELEQARSLVTCRELEAQAANSYFSAWAGQPLCRFATRDHARMPEHWQYYSLRRSPLNRGASARNAADPVNALLNYGYALAEAEARLAILTVGLDPGLGIIHTDQKSRDSLALDLLEPLRPVVERLVLQLLAVRHLTKDDVTETRDGRCRLLPPLTHDVAELALPLLREAVAKPAEAVAHLLAGSSPSKIDLKTPLSRADTIAAQAPGARSNTTAAKAAKTRPTCQRCGVDLYGSARKLCPTCWPVQRREHMRQLGEGRRGQAEPARPSVEELSGGISLGRYQTEILPGLAGLPLPEIERATGLSNATCSRLTRGLQLPNPKHWRALAALAVVRTPSVASQSGRAFQAGPDLPSADHEECSTGCRAIVGAAQLRTPTGSCPVRSP